MKWTQKDTEDLLKVAMEVLEEYNAGHVSAPLREISKRLGRSYKSIVSKITQIKAQGIPFPSFLDRKSDFEVEKALENMRDKVLDKEKEKALRSLLYEGSKQFHFLETLKEVIPRYEYIPPPKPKKEKKDLDEEDFVILISDIHGGMLIDRKETGGIGEYNIKIFNQRYEQFKTAVEKIIRIEGRNRPVKRVWFAKMVSVPQVFQIVYQFSIFLN